MWDKRTIPTLAQKLRKRIAPRPFKCASAPLQLPVVLRTVALAGGDMDPDYRATYLALIIIIIVCALALGIDFIVER
jgi:hypothetical protein